jgi:hypothetical protein
VCLLTAAVKSLGRGVGDRVMLMLRLSPDSSLSCADESGLAPEHCTSVGAECTQLATQTLVEYFDVPIGLN